MREIKFRAWNKITKTMLDLKKITPLVTDRFTGDGLFIPFEASVDLMQYTGLKDKNGKEIYEGDIVDQKYHWQIIFEDGCFWGTREARGDQGQRIELLFSIAQNRIRAKIPIEIIGNIYENPELLE